jgi:hypothetical protein
VSARPGEEDAGGQAPESAITDVRELLQAAARGDVDAAQVTESLQGYLEQHGPALRSSAAAAGEEVRQQLLRQLYGWRSQLDQQLGPRSGPPPHRSPGEATDIARENGGAGEP